MRPERGVIGRGVGHGRGIGFRVGCERQPSLAGGKLVIGAFEDGAITVFKKIIPLFESATGTKVQFLTEPYDSFFAKAFQDGTSKAGQYDIYIMDDPGSAIRRRWNPGGPRSARHHDGCRLPEPFADLGFWPPRQGPRVKGFETQEPKLVALPTIGDLQTLTYRNDVFTSGAPATWDDLVSQGRAAVTSGKIKYGIVFRGVKGNPIVTSFYPIFRSFGADFFDDKWNPIFNSAEGKQAADFFVTTLKALAPKGVAEFDSDQEEPRSSAAGGGDHPVLGQRHQIGRPGAIQGRRQARFRRGPEAKVGHRPDRDLHPRRQRFGAEQGQRDRVHEMARLE